VSAADTELMVYRYLFPRAVVAVFHRASGDTGMTVHAFFLVNPDDRRQLIPLHEPPPFVPFSVLLVSF
jgi:hypothetical protein